MSKKASTQIDWVISLAIFVIFLFGFFLFMMPRFEAARPPTSTLEQIEFGFNNEAGWTVEEVPIFTVADSASFEEPIVLRTDKNLEFPDARYVSRAGDRIVFLEKIDAGMNVFTGYTSEAFYNQIDITQDFTAIATDFGNGDIFVTFISGQMDTLDLPADQVIESVNYGFSPSESEFVNDSLTAYYRANEDDCIFVKDYNRIYCHTEGNLTFTLDEDFDEWEIINASGVDNGTTNENSNDVEVLLMKGGTMRLRFYFKPEADVEINFTPANPTVKIINADDYIITVNEPIAEYSYELGLGVLKQGISQTKLNEMYVKEGEELKTNWGVEYEFSVDVGDVYTYSTASLPVGGNIYTKAYSDNILDKYGNQTQVDVVLKIW